MVSILSSQLHQKFIQLTDHCIFLYLILQIYFRDTYIIHEFIVNHRQIAPDPIIEMNKDLDLSFSNSYTTQVVSCFDPNNRSFLQKNRIYILILNSYLKSKFTSDKFWYLWNQIEI